MTTADDDEPTVFISLREEREHRARMKDKKKRMKRKARCFWCHLGSAGESIVVDGNQRRVHAGCAAEAQEWLRFRAARR